MKDYAAAHDRFHASGFEPEEGLVRVHHEISQHLGKCDCDWSGLVVEMRRDSVDLSKALPEDLPMSVVAALRAAQDAGVGFADVVTMLTSHGWEVRLVPAGASVGEAVEAAVDVREGSFVSWNSSGGRARGQVEHVMTEGTLGVPGSSFSINATEDDPAVLIRIWREGSEGWEATETLVGHRASTLTAIGDLSKAATKRENGEDFPAEAFAYTPDLERPSTWKLRLWDSLEERETRAQVSRAVQALSASGFRGNRVEIPSEDIESVKAKVLAAWEKVNPDREAPRVLKQESYEPPVAVQEAAQRALGWISDGRAGSGFTDVGRARAAQLARGAAVSRETIARMRSYFARHEIDQQAEGWNRGEDGFPTPGRVAWDAWGGDAGREWANMIWDRLQASSGDPVLDLGGPVGDLRKSEEHRFTLGPWYIPDMIDAHGEFTDADELQRALWRYVRSGDRRIRLQHNVEVVAGEAVEMMTWPNEVTLPLAMPDGSVSEATFPPNTVFLGVVWEPWAWEYVKAGRISGYSIGGTTDRVMVDMPE